MNNDIALNLLNLAGGGLATLLNVGLLVIGLIHVRRVHTFAGLCFAGAGAVGALSSLLRRLGGVATSIVGNSIIYTISQILASLLAIAGALLIPVGIFLLANALKQHSNPSH